MYSFLLDAWAAIRLHFSPPEHYRYPLAITCGVLLATAAVNAATMTPWFGHDDGAVVLIFCLTILKWLTLSLSMNVVLHYYGSPKINWYGYILLTEALIIPMIAVFYFPRLLAFPSILWKTWIIVVQIFGIMQLSKQNISKILLAYLVYGLMVIVTSYLLINVFVSMDWLDRKTITKLMQTMMNTPHE